MKQKAVSNHIVLVYDGKPASYNAKKKESVKLFQKRIASCYDRKYKGKLTQNKLYATVYYFYREDTKIDTDNISKPLWDALRAKAFDDDFQIKVRCAASINLEEEMVILDDTLIPRDVFYELSDGIDNHDHTLYIELGELETVDKLFQQTALWK